MINAAALFSYLNFLTVDVDAFLRSLEIDLETVRSSEPYIPIELCLLIQDEAANFVDDPFLGLLMGEFAGAGSWSILGCTMMNCNTLGEDYTRHSLICPRL